MMILACFAVPVTFGLIGLVVDIGWMYWRKEACLTAAQSAAMAAVAKVASQTSFTCISGGSGNVWCSSTPGTPTQCPTSLPSNNFGTACKYASANFFSTSTANQNVTVDANTGNAPTVSGVSPSYYVTVRVTEKRPVSFLAALTRAISGTVSARATAAIFSSGAGGGCVYVLDPTDSKTVYVTGSSTVLDTSCGMKVFSNSASAIQVNGLGTINANYQTSGNTINVAGNPGYTINTGSISPTPTSGGTFTDPFASLTAPSYGTTCTKTNYYADMNSNYNATLQPGVYCGGISIGNGGKVTFASGTYILAGGGLKVQSAQVAWDNSTGVTFYATSCSGITSCSGCTGSSCTYQPLFIGSQANAVTLQAPTTGSYKGILFWADKNAFQTNCSQGASDTSTLNGNTNTQLTGSIYLPNTSLYITGESSPGTYTGLVSYCLTVDGNSDVVLKNDSTGQYTGIATSSTTKTGLIE